MQEVSYREDKLAQHRRALVIAIYDGSPKGKTIWAQKTTQ
jgi:hypothetical protein